MQEGVSLDFLRTKDLGYFLLQCDMNPGLDNSNPTHIHRTIMCRVNNKQRTFDGSAVSCCSEKIPSSPSCAGNQIAFSLPDES